MNAVFRFYLVRQPALQRCPFHAIGLPVMVTKSNRPPLNKFALVLQRLHDAHVDRTCIMVKTALVTGATGFLGRQVSQAFKSAGFQVVDTGFTRANPPATLKLDLSNPAEISSALENVK